MEPNEEGNFASFRDSLSGTLLISLQPGTKEKRKEKRRSRKAHVTAVGDEKQKVAEEVEDFSDFIDYIAKGVFQCLPDELKTLNYSAIHSNPAIADNYTSATSLEEWSDTVDSSISESLEAYSLPSLEWIMKNTVPSYIATVTAPPPVWVTTRASECELCERDWVNLSYHHLIPRSVHDKVLKRGWHDEFELNKVAWLCGACHRYIHRVASNEELAREWHTVDRLKSRDDIQKFIGWVGRVRYKKK